MSRQTLVLEYRDNVRIKRVNRSAIRTIVGIALIVLIAIYQYVLPSFITAI